MDDDLERRLIDSIHRDPSRVALLLGAGLSMAPPSDLPSASDLARECYRRYQARVGEQLPEDVRANLGRLASTLWNRDQLRSPFLQDIVPWDYFHGKFNDGHEAVADFLICGAVDFVVTTNFDTLVEDAAQILNRPSLEPALDGREVQDIGRARHNPYVKMHGCHKKSRRETLWSEQQLTCPPYSDRRIPTTIRWLTGLLEYRHIIIIGFWTDWSYINALLDDCLFGLDAGDQLFVTVVDTKSTGELERSAPNLWNWVASQDDVTFHHERQSGADFLEDLRVSYSRRFLNRAIIQGAPRPTCHGLPTDLTGRQLYHLRKDFTGAVANDPVTQKDPGQGEARVGEMHETLLGAGGQMVDGIRYRIRGQIIRLVNGSGYRLSTVKRMVTAELGSPLEVDVVVCVGAQADPSVAHLVRDVGERENVHAGDGKSVVDAGHNSTWVTDVEFQRWLNEGGGDEDN